MATQKRYENWIQQQEKPVCKKELTVEPKLSVIYLNEEDEKDALAQLKKQQYAGAELVSLEHFAERKEGYGYVTVFVKGMLLAPDAYYAMLQFIDEQEDIRFVYADEDKVDANGKNRRNPYFKPDYSPYLLRCFNYIGPFFVMDEGAACKVVAKMKEEGRLNPFFRNEEEKVAFLYEFILYATTYVRIPSIGHLPRILCHVVSDREDASQVTPAEEKAKTIFAKLYGWGAAFVPVPDMTCTIPVYSMAKEARVSIIIPSKDQPKLLQRCINSIKEITEYRNYEIIVVDNGSSDANRETLEEYLKLMEVNYIYRPMEFNFATMCNLGAEAATGRYLLFLNDDMEIIQKDWLTILLGQAIRKHTGAVGAKLYYPGTKTIQHCGVANLAMGPSHYLGGKEDDKVYYFGKNRLAVDAVAVTAACLMVKKDRFMQVGGFEEKLAIAYNDVDLCMKLDKAGYISVVRNDVVLYHHESASRGLDHMSEEKRMRLHKELELLWTLHPAANGGKDPYYSVHFAPDYSDFRIVAAKSTLDFSEPVTGIKNLDTKEAGYPLLVDLVQTKPAIVIGGWCYWKDDKAMEKADILLALRNEEGEVLLFETVRTEREDAAKAIGVENAMIGFSARIKDTDLPKGTYTVGTCIRSNELFRNRLLVMWSGEKLCIM